MYDVCTGKSKKIEQSRTERAAVSVAGRSFRERVYEDRGLTVGRAQSKILCPWKNPVPKRSACRSPETKDRWPNTVRRGAELPGATLGSTFRCMFAGWKPCGGKARSSALRAKTGPLVRIILSAQLSSRPRSVRVTRYGDHCAPGWPSAAEPPPTSSRSLRPQGGDQAPLMKFSTNACRSERARW